MKTTITTTTITDDFCGAGDAETITFAYKGREYEIDLNRRNKDTFERRQEALYSPYVEHARDITDDVAVFNRRIRAWALKNGLQIGLRGRIPQEVIDQYNTAQEES